MKKNIFSSQCSWENFRVSFPKEEKVVPWLSSLLDAYAMIDASVFVAIEKSERKPACKKGCFVCCSHTIPLTYLELFGIQWFREKEKKERVQREDTSSPYALHLSTEQEASVPFSSLHTPALKSSAQSKQAVHLGICPMLKDNACSIYPLRPIACRRFIVFGNPCQKDEDCLTSRSSDVLIPSRKVLERALLLTQPFYIKTGQWTKEISDISPFWGELLTEIRQFDWSEEEQK